MNGVPPLEFAGVSHWAALAVLLAAGACILELGQSYKKTVRNRTTFWLGAACLFSLVPDLAAMLADEPEKNWTWMLPLHFCSVMQVVCALSLWIPSRRLRSVAYYCVLCATLQGHRTPTSASSSRLYNKELSGALFSGSGRAVLRGFRRKRRGWEERFPFNGGTGNCPCGPWDNGGRGV